MYEMKQRVNPLKQDALTAHDVEAGDKIICWVPKKSDTTRHLTILNGPYPDEDGTLVVDLRNEETGKEWTEDADTVGLTGNRYTGEWTVIAIADEEFDV